MGRFLFSGMGSRPTDILNVPLGYPLVGESATLLPGHTYHVSLAVQATPPGAQKRLLLRLFIPSMIILPRQARDVYSNYGK
jgi:hypothetical protein